MFDGSPAQFHQWEFRTQLRAGSHKPRAAQSSQGETSKEAEGDDEAVPDDSKSAYKTVDNIINGLRGDALQVAMDLQIEVLVKEDGIAKLIEAMRAYVFPSKKHEAKELYSQGHKVGGILSRQPGESMLSYTNRRRRWWRLLVQMDSSIGLSDDIQGDLLLDNAMLDDKERLMIMTSTGNSTGFEKIAEALQLQSIAKDGQGWWTSASRSPPVSSEGVPDYQSTACPSCSQVMVCPS